MLDTNWGPWTDWTGGEPPVPNGTLIEALVMVRVQDLHRAKPPHFNHIIFRTGNGDSFRLKPLINYPKECLTLIYRYRAWQDECTIHSEMSEEVSIPLEGVLP
jgi:hypothetical protein